MRQITAKQQKRITGKQEYHCRGYNKKWVWSKEVQETPKPEPETKKDTICPYSENCIIPKETAKLLYMLLVEWLLVFLLWFMLCIIYYRSGNGKQVILWIVSLVCLMFVLACMGLYNKRHKTGEKVTRYLYRDYLLPIYPALLFIITNSFVIVLIYKFVMMTLKNVWNWFWLLIFLSVYICFVWWRNMYEAEYAKSVIAAYFVVIILWNTYDYYWKEKEIENV